MLMVKRVSPWPSACSFPPSILEVMLRYQTLERWTANPFIPLFWCDMQPYTQIFLSTRKCAHPLGDVVVAMRDGHILHNIARMQDVTAGGRHLRAAQGDPDPERRLLCLKYEVGGMHTKGRPEGA
eukprot:1160006-Pelagomonas_calceolata.AAC.6